MKIGLYSILFILISLTLSAQTGMPFIENFSPEDYHAEGQIWSAVQDNDGIMYFGSNSGILQYDGNSWQKINLPNTSAVRSLCKNKKGIIFAGAVGEFGYLKKTKKGLIKYVSLSSDLDSALHSFSDVWTMHAKNNNVYFATNEYLFRYNPEKEPHVIKINTEKPPFLLYKAGNDIFVSIRNQGTYRLEGDNLFSLKGMEKEHPWFIINYNSTCKIIGNYDGIIIYNPNAPSKDKYLTTDSFYNKNEIKKTNEFLSTNQLYTGALSLENGEFAVGTIRAGVVILNKNGKIINVIDEDKGLQSNTIHNLCKDNQNEIWINTAYGISRAEINSPYELFNKNSGIKGSIYNVLRFHNKFYINSNLGLYYYTKTGFKGANSLSGKDALQILSPFIFQTKTDSVFFVNTIYGMYRIDNDKVEKINRINYNSIIQSEYNNNTVYYTENYTLYKMIFRNGTFFKPEKIKKFKNLAYIGYEFNKENIFLLLNQKPVLYNFKTQKIKEFNIEAEISDIAKLDGKFFAYSNIGMFIYDTNKQEFYKDTLYTAGLPENIEILQFDKYSENAFWILAKNNKENTSFIARIFKKGNNYQTETTPYKRFSGINAFYADGDSLLWAVNNKILYKYRIQNNKNFKQKESCLIRKINLKNDSVIYKGTVSSIDSSGKILKTDYQYNDILFEYTLTSYDGNKNEYAYKLENGKKSSWSAWSDVNFKEYTNLHEGSYIFYVKGRNVYGIESNPVSFSFEILPPWYRSWYAFITYFIFLIILIWGFVKLNAKRLEQDNIRLDNIVKERTAEILTQKEEIQTQANYLEEVNNELNQKNEEISSIAENLKEANSKINIKNKYIIDSINYAQKIQNAALPSETEIAKIISDFFIIYKPKDIVSGDFYFIKKRSDYLILAVADCTGHGVPGGFLAMMSMAVLSDVIQDTEITNPASALEKMRKIIKLALHQNTYLESRNEGIEIALCAVNTKNLSLEFAGANHPLFIARQKGKEAEIIEIPADSQPVGIHYKEKPFELKQFQLKENDMLYMFSDGYFDQFGGPDKKKFLLNNLKDLLKDLSNESIKIQKREILNAFNSWKGENKQVDDVLLFGIRVKNF